MEEDIIDLYVLYRVSHGSLRQPFKEQGSLGINIAYLDLEMRFGKALVLSTDPLPDL